MRPCACVGYVHILGPGDRRCRCGHTIDLHVDNLCTMVYDD